MCLIMSHSLCYLVQYIHDNHPLKKYYSDNKNQIFAKQITEVYLSLKLLSQLLQSLLSANQKNKQKLLLTGKKTYAEC